jgi:hypothetical protein
MAEILRVRDVKDVLKYICGDSYAMGSVINVKLLNLLACHIFYNYNM